MRTSRWARRPSRWKWQAARWPAWIRSRRLSEAWCSTRQIAELPLNGRNYLELARLEPGVEINEGRAFDPTKARYTGVSIGGRSGRETRITIDGIDAVDEHVGTTTLNLSQESIQEFQVSTSSSDASTGLSATGRRQHHHEARLEYLSRVGLRLWTRLRAWRRAPVSLRRSRISTASSGAAISAGRGEGQAVLVRQFREEPRELARSACRRRISRASRRWPAPYDERSSSVRVDYKAAAEQRSLLPLEPQRQQQLRRIRRQPAAFGGEFQQQHYAPDCGGAGLHASRRG